MDSYIAKEIVIPQIIHYCWLSGDEWDEKTVNCFKSWKKILPDWEYKYWTVQSLPQEVLTVPTVKWAIKNKKWAFAADYIRIWALKTYGGLYMDLDVELLKSPLDIFTQKLVVGYEKELIGAHFMAAVPSHPFIEAIEVELRNKTKQEPLPSFITPIYKSLRSKGLDVLDEPFPETNFNPFYWDAESGKGDLNVTENTYCIHWYVGGWIPKYKKTNWYKKLIQFAKSTGLLIVLRKLRGY